MATIKFILDTRLKNNGTASILLKFNHRYVRKKMTIGINVKPENYDADTETISPKQKNYRQLNQQLQYCKAAAEGVLLRHLKDEGDGEAIYAEIEAAIFPDRVAAKQQKKELEAQEEAKKSYLLAVARRFTELKKPSTQLTYQRTLKHLEAFCGEGHPEDLDLLNRAWLTAFDNYLAKSNPSANARALHFRNLRAIINYAIDEELTTNYPFRRFKIKTVKTEKRSLSAATLRDVLSYDIEEWQEVYRDMFTLSFMLMGINFADLLTLKKKDLRDGRIVFNRSKTARLYSMKVEPEAMKLIQKYAGQRHLLSIMDSRTNYLQFIRQTNNALGKIGDCERSGLGGKKKHSAICPELTTYWARHTWATIAASLDIPKETIAAALGHGGNTVTDIYIDFDRNKVDAANRRVLDWILYGIKDGQQEVTGIKTAYGEEPKKKRATRENVPTDKKKKKVA